MRCEVVAVGTELLLGQIVDTNSSWIGQRLAEVGIDSLYQTKVGDNARRIRASLELALSRSDAVIVCGGLGPTQDDITRDVIAEVMGVELVRDDAIADKIRAMFEARGRSMPLNNLRQADVPVGAATMAEQPGTAPGLVCPIGELDDRGISAKVIYAVPGVPMEMRQMVDGTVVADLQRRSGETSTIVSRVLRTWGLSESGLAEVLADRMTELDRTGGPTLAFLASGVEGLKVRITAKAPDRAAADAMLAAEEHIVRELLGDVVFGVDDQTMESVVLDLLAERHLSLAIAEGVTDGYIGHRVASANAGRSLPADDNSGFVGSIIMTDRALRRDELGVTAAAASPEAAAQLARGVQRVLRSDVGLATVGEPGSGTVFVGLAIGDDVDAWPLRVPTDADRLRQYTCIGLLDSVRRRLS